MALSFEASSPTGARFRFVYLHMLIRLVKVDSTESVGSQQPINAFGTVLLRQFRFRLISRDLRLAVIIWREMECLPTKSMAALITTVNGPYEEPLLTKSMRNVA